MLGGVWTLVAAVGLVAGLTAAQAQDKRLLPSSGGVYGKRAALGKGWMKGWLGRVGKRQVPLSGMMYGKRGVPINGGMYGKRSGLQIRAVPSSGGLYGR